MVNTLKQINSKISYFDVDREAKASISPNAILNNAANKT